MSKSSKTTQTIGKHGITGNSGLFVIPGIFHISASYDSNGKVFVDTDDFTWERMTKEQAKKQQKPVISCFICKSPAVSLDHLYPYYSEMNRCAKHYNTKLK